MSSDFKKLNLDRSLLKDAIQSYWSSNECAQGNYLESSFNRHKATYIKNDCEVMVEFIFINDGTTTIHTKIGKNQEVGKQLAAYLKDELVSDSRKSVNFTIKNIGGEVFDDLLTFLQELDNEASQLSAISLESLTEDAIKKAAKVRTQYKDLLTLTHYKTRNKLLIQGKPLYAYAQVSYFLSEYTDLDGFLDIVYRGEADPGKVDVVDKNTIETELRALLPSAYNELGEGILKLISTSYALREASLDLPDYSCYVFPVLRALEGVIKRLLATKDIYLERRPVGKVFQPARDDSSKTHIVNQEYRLRFSDSKLCDALEICYNRYNQQRNRLFHIDDLTDDSMFISTRDKAVENINEVIGIIESAYKKII